MKGFRRNRALIGFLFIAVLSSCTAPQKSRVLMRWDPEETGRTQVYSSFTTSAYPMDNGILVYRSTLPKASLEIYAADGKRTAQIHFPESLLQVRVAGDLVYFTKQAASPATTIWKWRPPDEPVKLGTSANWTDIAVEANGSVLAFESIYSSRDRAPSAVRIVDPTTMNIVHEDMMSYQYPLRMKSRMLVSPIDRWVRLLTGSGYTKVGRINSLQFPPVVRADGEFAVWFGPYNSGTALFVSDASGNAVPLVAPLTERPVAWTDEELFVATRNPITGRRTITRYAVPSGVVKGEILLPQAIGAPKASESGSDPSADQSFSFKPSPDGSIIGFSADRGSQFFHVSTGFIEEFPEVPLSSWYFSPDGKVLYLFDRSRLEAIDL